MRAAWARVSVQVKTSALSEVAPTVTPEASGCVVADDTWFSYRTEASEGWGRRPPPVRLDMEIKKARDILLFSMNGTIPTNSMIFTLDAGARYSPYVGVGIPRQQPLSASGGEPTSSSQIDARSNLSGLVAGVPSC